jgi:UDP-2-acetamido-3-amino-2,3-dideoxy-glucuronate N-acetyltransferase
MSAATIHPTAVVDEDCTIGEGTKIWHFSHVLSHSRIGANVSVGQNVAIGPKVTIGDGCKIQNNVSVYEGVTLEDDVFCGPSCVFTNVLTPRAFVNRKAEFGQIRVKKGATIGANATIVCGDPNKATTLGEYCFIAAGAVVTKDVDPYALMAGVPARRIGWVSRSGDVLKSDLVCPRTGERYAVEGGKLKPL